MTRSPWIRAARLQLHTIGFTPLLLGNIIAWYEFGQFSWPRLILSLLIGLLIHLVTAFVNDVADVQTDEANVSRTPFSGGSGVVVEGQLSRSDLITGASWAVFLAAVLTGVMIFGLHVHWGILLFVIWGIVSATEYSLPPVKLSYRGGGEFLVFVTYGIALVWAGYYSQAGPAYSPLVWALSIPIGFAVFSLITITQFPDLEADRKAGKRSLVIAFGVQKTLSIVSLAVLSSVLSVTVFLLTGSIPIWAGVLSLLSLPLAVRLLKMMLRHEMEGISLYIKLSQGTLILTLWLGLAPALGLMLDRWLRVPG
ncbi:MAG TPA: prenyltransferase [Syntrophales bacterium]|nr:prenyltransferase [Syntrophales bacterium]